MPEGLLGLKSYKVGCTKVTLYFLNGNNYLRIVLLVQYQIIGSILDINISLPQLNYYVIIEAGKWKYRPCVDKNFGHIFENGRHMREVK